MIVRLLFATVFAAAVSIALWAGASALIEPEPFLDEAPSMIRASQVQLCVDCEDDVPPPPPPGYDCRSDGWGLCPPPRDCGFVGCGSYPDVPIVRIGPVYPSECGGSARVEAELSLDASGRVVDAEIVRSDNACFDQATLDAMRKWIYPPAEDIRSRSVLASVRYEV